MPRPVDLAANEAVADAEAALIDALRPSASPADDESRYALAAGRADWLARARAARLFYGSIDTVRALESDADAAKRLVSLLEWLRKPSGGDRFRVQAIANRALGALGGSLRDALGRDLQRERDLVAGLLGDERYLFAGDDRALMEAWRAQGGVQRFVTECVHVDDPRATLLKRLDDARS